jgi:hypothetical protein
MTLRHALVLMALSTGVVVAACGGRRGVSGQISAPDRGRATSAVASSPDEQARCEYKGREDREVSETAGPGALLPNVRRVFQIVGQGEDRRRVLVCREVDTNLDGVKDVVRTFNDKGEALHEEADANYDGKVDTWVTFVAGRMSQEAIDNDGDGQPDTWKYYSALDSSGREPDPTAPVRLSRIQRDTNRDGKPDVWEFYDRGRLERMGVDIDFDGKVDRWDHDEVVRRAADAAEKAAQRSEGAVKQGDQADAGAPASGEADGGAQGEGAGAGAGADAGAGATGKRKKGR